MRRSATKNLTLTAMFLALGILLPFVTGQIPAIGSMLLPMHIPVFFCGLICGWQYGLIIGFVTPLLRSSLLGMPPLFPTASAMAFELAAYGFFSGLFYKLFRKKDVVSLYASLLLAMVLGRGVWGFVQYVQLSFTGSPLTWPVFVSSAFLTAFPGILLQLVLIPAVMLALGKAGFIEFHLAVRRKRIAG